MAYKDLREFIERLESQGELQRVEEEVDWNLEVGAILRRCYDLQAPAPLFESLKGYPGGYRIFGAPIGPSSKPDRLFIRAALAMDMNPDATFSEIIEEYIKRKKKPLKPVLVKDGPCKENIHLGNDVDLLEFPAPFLHEGDGGRYIGTWHIIVTRDPDSGWVNWGMYRLMIHDQKIMGGLVHPFQHIGLHYYQKYESRNKPMEFAVAIGTEPVSSMIGSAFLGEGVNEADVVGALRREPIELINCETNDLAVPATSEIVIEGEMLPYERKDEGPFGEYTGYRVSDKAPRPVYRVKAITHRDEPILTVSCPGPPIDDSAITQPLTKAAEILEELRSKGFLVKMIYAPPEAVCHLLVVSTKVPFSNYAEYLAHAIWGTRAGRTVPFLVVVEDDIDVTNMDEVLWALTTRCHPERGILKNPKAPGHPLLPFLSPHERKNNLGASVLFDCTWPKDWPKESVPVKASFDSVWPQEVQEKVLKKWTTYGFKEK